MSLTLPWCYLSAYSQTIESILGIGLIVFLCFIMRNKGSKYKKKIWFIQASFCLCFSLSIALYPIFYDFFQIALLEKFAQLEENQNNHEFPTYILPSDIEPSYIDSISMDTDHSDNQHVNNALCFSQSILPSLFILPFEFGDNEIKLSFLSSLLGWTLSKVLFCLFFNTGFAWLIGCLLKNNCSAVKISTLIHAGCWLFFGCYLSIQTYMVIFYGDGYYTNHPIVPEGAGIDLLQLEENRFTFVCLFFLSFIIAAFYVNLANRSTSAYRRLNWILYFYFIEVLEFLLIHALFQGIWKTIKNQKDYNQDPHHPLSSWDSYTLEVKELFFLKTCLSVAFVVGVYFLVMCISKLSSAWLDEHFDQRPIQIIRLKPSLSQLHSVDLHHHRQSLNEQIKPLSWPINEKGYFIV